MKDEAKAKTAGRAEARTGRRPCPRRAVPRPNKPPGEKLENAHAARFRRWPARDEERTRRIARGAPAAVQLNKDIKPGPGVGTGVGPGVGAGVEPRRADALADHLQRDRRQRRHQHRRLQPRHRRRRPRRSLDDAGRRRGRRRGWRRPGRRDARPCRRSRWRRRRWCSGWHAAAGRQRQGIALDRGDQARLRAQQGRDLFDLQPCAARGTRAAGQGRARTEDRASRPGRRPADRFERAEIGRTSSASCSRASSSSISARRMSTRSRSRGRSTSCRPSSTHQGGRFTPAEILRSDGPTSRQRRPPPYASSSI